MQINSVKYKQKLLFTYTSSSAPSSSSPPLHLSWSENGPYFLSAKNVAVRRSKIEVLRDGVTSAKKVMFYSVSVCLFVFLSLSLSLLATWRNNYWSDLRENFTRNESVDGEQPVETLWQSSASGIGILK